MTKTIIEVDPSDFRTKELTRTISVRISDEQYKKLRMSRIQIAPYIRELINTLTEEKRGMKIWKKR